MISNHRNLEHAINLLRSPATAAKQQLDFNNKRLARIEKALSTRPVYIPMKFDLLAASQTSAYNQISKPLPYDVIITGVISNNGNRQIVIRESYQDTKICLTGESRNTYLKLSDLGGGNFLTTSGKKGLSPFPSPLTLRRNNRLDVDIYKTAATAAAEVLQVVFVGYRVYKSSRLDEEQLPLVQQFMNARDYPRTVFLKHKINFDVAGVDGVALGLFTPESDEFLLIRGVRTTLSFSNCLIKLSGESEWTINNTPIWAIAAESENDQMSYLYFERPIPYPAKNVIEMSFFNGADGVNIDPQNDNEITWICETV